MLANLLVVTANTVHSNQKNDAKMKVLSSLKTAKTRHPGCKVVRRHGVVYVICKENPRFKARQGGKKKR